MIAPRNAALEEGVIVERGDMEHGRIVPGPRPRRGGRERRKHRAGRSAPAGRPLPAGLNEAKLDNIRFAVKLSREPGWNQVAADWRLMLKVGDSFGVSTAEGRLVASGLTVPFGSRFGWISMILVTEAFRRRGLATYLMGRCMAALQARGLVQALDATPEGRKVYRTLGFKDVYRITRFFAAAPGLGEIAPPAGLRLQRMAATDLAAIAAYDAPIFGADRAFLIEHLRARRPAQALLASRETKICGYVVAREGQTSAQIGPLVADDGATALALLSRSLQASSGAVCIDLVNSHRGMRKQLMSHGFAPQFPFIRMIYKRSKPFDDARRVFAIAGPELG
jgi:GNAT superfamily N-acetyltransferase